MRQLSGHHPAGEHGLRIYFAATPKYKTVGYRMKCAVRTAIEATLQYEDFRRDAEVSVTFCDNAYIRRLNAAYRKKDSATDVLSFPMLEGDDAVAADEPASLGDVVISLERAEEQAKELGHSLVREVMFLCILSSLHLVGYDHETSTESEEDMCARQRAILGILTAYDLIDDGEKA